MDRETWSGLERGEERCAACERALAGEAAAFAVLFSSGDGFRRRDFCEACFRALPAKPASFWRRAPAREAAKEAGGKEKRAARRRDLDAMLELFERLSGEGATPAAAAAEATQASVASAPMEALAMSDRSSSDDPSTAAPSLTAPAIDSQPTIDPASSGPATTAPDDAGRSKDEQAKLRYLLALALVRRRRLELVDLAREGGADCLVLRRSGQAELLTVSAPVLAEADLARLSRELEAEVGLG
jgi:hypothetical protein